MRMRNFKSGLDLTGELSMAEDSAWEVIEGKGGVLGRFKELEGPSNQLTAGPTFCHLPRNAGSIIKLPRRTALWKSPTEEFSFHFRCMALGARIPAMRTIDDAPRNHLLSAAVELGLFQIGNFEVASGCSNFDSYSDNNLIKIKSSTVESKLGPGGTQRLSL
jgi:hypothetical protein